MTPFSTEVELVREVDATNGYEDLVRVTVLLTADPPPLREFRPFLTVDLDEAHATELLGKLSVALMKLHTGEGAE